jgi:aspartate aminotransferase
LLADGVPVIIKTTQETGFKMSAQQLDDCLKAHPRAKALVLNSPSNPTGAVYTPAHLRELCAVLDNYPNVLVISDEIYEHMVYAPNEQWSVARYSEDFARRTILVQGVSKSYSMTGWRIGWTACSKELAAAMGKLQSQSTSNPTSFAQAGAIAALDGGVNQEMLAEFEKRGKVIRELLNDVPGFECARPEGAFYAFPKVSGIFGVMVEKDTQLQSADDLAAYLLRVAKVAVVPGEGFGAPDHVRFSYANSMENIKEGIRRILYVLPE